MDHWVFVKIHHHLHPLLGRRELCSRDMIFSLSQILDKPQLCHCSCVSGNNLNWLDDIVGGRTYDAK